MSRPPHHTGGAKVPQLAGWTQRMGRSALEDMLVATAQPEVLSLALGLPAPELFPTAEMGTAIQGLLAGDTRALQYGPPREDLKRFVAGLMKTRGVDCKPEQIFLTAGAQQAMSLAARILLEPDAATGRPPTVLVEEQSYPGFLQVLAAHEPEIVTVPTDPEHGIDLGALEAALEGAPKESARPALLYTMSDGHNPLGVSLSIEARRHLVELARRHHLPILEDDAYGMIAYDDEARPALRAFDDDWIIYAGSFSKTLAPALRTGWLVVPERFLRALGSLKEASDINTATLGQRAIAAYLEDGGLQVQVERLRRAYRERRDVMLSALEQTLPATARWSVPRAGFFVWVELPGVDTTRLLEIALRHELLAFLPGSAFTAGHAPPARHALRLNFSYGSPDLIREGVARLGRSLSRLYETNAATRG